MQSSVKLYRYLVFASVVLAIWVLLLYPFEGIYNTTTTRFAPIIMLFGSFIAGVSSEGGGAIAFPAFTLIFDMSPMVARNFSFAIQSVGMTAASLLLLDLRTRFHQPAILWGTVGGSLGLVLGSMIPTSALDYGLLKLVFVSIWLSFGVTLFFLLKQKKRKAVSDLGTVNKSMINQLVVFSIIGGFITALFGNGIDILIFSVLVLRFKVDIKTATATSIVLMTIHTILGFGIHLFVLKDFGVLEFNMWLACIPVVVLGAPLGAFVLNKINQQPIVYFLLFIIATQFIGALFVLRPSLVHIGISLVVIIVGLFLFGAMGRGRGSE